jgi:hypothetical protein
MNETTLLCEGQVVTFKTMSTVYGLSDKELETMCKQPEFVYQDFKYQVVRKVEQIAPVKKDSKKSKRCYIKRLKAVFDITNAVEHEGSTEGLFIRCHVNNSDRTYSIGKTQEIMNTCSHLFNGYCKKYQSFIVSGYNIDVVLYRDSSKFIYSLYDINDSVLLDKVPYLDVMDETGATLHNIRDAFNGYKDSGKKVFFHDKWYIVRGFK